MVFSLRHLAVQEQLPHIAQRSAGQRNQAAVVAVA